MFIIFVRIGPSLGTPYLPKLGGSLYIYVNSKGTSCLVAGIFFPIQFDFLVHFCLDGSKLTATKKRKGITTLVLELHNFDHSKLHIEIMLAVRIEILF